MTEQINPPAITRTMLPDARTATIEQLRSAFPANEIDSRDAFASWGATYLDGADYAKQLDGKSWNELDRSYLDRRSDALGFLSTKHLVAVLPAYLAQLVEGGLFSQVPDMLLLILTAPDSTKRNGLGAARFGKLTEALSESQRAAVAGTLHWFVQEHPTTEHANAAQIALDRYWLGFLKREA
jgi:hypothetical protein